jgi:hypothetical protein
MKLAILFLGFLIIFTSCQDKGHQTKTDLNVPDKVKIKKDNKYQQFPGTRIFIVNPPGYILIPSLVRFQKANGNYIQALEIPNADFRKEKNSIKQEIESAKSKGITVYYNKGFKLGNYDAYLVYSEDSNPNLDRMTLLFGDSSFGAIVIGEMPRNDDKARREILSALMTTYLDKSIKPNVSDIANYSIDVSKSEFKYNKNISQIFYYTIHGQGDPINNSFVDNFIVVTLPTMESFEARKTYAQSMIQRYKNNGIYISTSNSKEVEINDLKAYETILNGNYQGKPVLIYLVILGDNKATILFCGSAYNRQDELLKQFEGIAQTLKIK